MPRITRRSFLKSLCALGAAVATGTFTAYRIVTGKSRRKKDASLLHGACTWCGMHCALQIYHKDGKVITVEGASSPTNSGLVCPKGVQTAKDIFESREEKASIYTALDGSLRNVSPDEALQRASVLLKAERDRSFITKRAGITLNRLETVAALAGTQVANEDAYLFNRLCRLAGIRDVGSDSLLLESDADRAISASFGAPAQTNSWSDLRNSDCILIVGSNPVRTTPIALSHITSARERGAKIITISPDRNETSVISDLHITIRPGTDLYFLLSLIRYSLTNNAYNDRYLKEHTDAPFLISEDFLTTDNKDRFPGFNQASGTYTDMTSWSYIIDERGNPRADYNMNRSNTVFQIIKKYYNRYTPDRVIRKTGCSADAFLMAAEMYFNCANDEHSASIIYGGGFTDSAGIQGVRALSMLQLLSGNIGVSGGGLYGMHLRGNSQGVADQTGSWNMLPGYLPLPDGDMNEDYESYVKNNSRKSNDSRGKNLWNNFKSYADSLLASWYTKTPSVAFNYLPRRDYIFTGSNFLADLQSASQYKGLILLDSDPLDSAYSRAKMKEALSALDWIILIRSKESQMHEFVKEINENSLLEVVDIQYSSSMLSGGTYTSSDRIIHGPYNPENEKDNTAISLLGSLYEKLRSLYERFGGNYPEPLTASTWKFATYADVRSEIEGAGIVKGGASFQELKENGQTKCGNWLYAGVYSYLATQKKDASVQVRDNSVFPEWKISWPLNNRLLYNRAAAPSAPKSAFSDDVRLFPDLKEGRAFYFSQEAAARLFAPMPEGPIPLPIESSTDEEEKKILLYSRDSGESRFAHHKTDYDEVYAGECLRMHPQTAASLGLASGERVRLENSHGSVSLLLVTVAREDLLNEIGEISGRAMQMLQKPVDILQESTYYTAVIQRDV